ncbi:GGDEF domain-containing protein [Caminibacter sp.]
MKKKVLIIIAIIMIISTIIRTAIVSFSFLNFSNEIILNQSKLIKEILQEVIDKDKFMKIIQHSKDIKAIEFKPKISSNLKIKYNIEDKEIKIIIPFNKTENLIIYYDGNVYFQKIFNAILQLILIALISLIIIILIVNYYLTPYLEILEKVKNITHKMLKGNFNYKINTNLGGEAKDFVHDFNEFMEKMKNSFGVIEEKYTTLIEKEKGDDPLNDAKETIEQLANIFQFKRMIEDDSNTQNILSRLVTVIKNFNINNFSIIAIDNSEKKAKIFFSAGDICCNIEKNFEECRAYRLKKEINSFKYPDICLMHYCKNSYICLPFSSGGNFTGILKIMDNDFEKIKKILPYIKAYLNETSNVIEAKFTLELLHNQSIKDPLTGLFNRRYLENILVPVINSALRRNEKIGFLMIDMDYFKKVNDTYGHSAGDIVLKKMAEILKKNVRKSDIVIRYGGEEFLILLQNIKSAEDALEVAEKIRKEIESAEFDIGERKIKKTASIGVALFPDECKKSWECIKAADSALYEAKKTGRNKVILFKPEYLT